MILSRTQNYAVCVANGFRVVISTHNPEGSEVFSLNARDANMLQEKRRTRPIKEPRDLL